MICCRTMAKAIGTGAVSVDVLPTGKPDLTMGNRFGPRVPSLYHMFFCPFCGTQIPEEFEAEPLREQGQWFTDLVSDIGKKDPCDRSDWIQPVLRPEEYELRRDTGCETVTEGQKDGTDAEEQGP